MKQLPKGYVAVVADYENAPKDTFTYKGETYAVSAGENLFANVIEAIAHAADTPTEVLSGLPYTAFDAPVMLFSAGRHNIDHFVLDRSIYLFGEGAGVNPNLPTARREDEPQKNPLRAEERETLLYGSYDFGKPRVQGEGIDTVVLDGLSLKNVSFRDLRSSGGKCFVAIRNVIEEQCNPTMMFLFVPAKAGSELHREVEISHLRVVDFDDYGYANPAVMINADRAVLDDICYVRAGNPFGLSDIPLSRSAVPGNAAHAEVILKNSYFADLATYSNIGVSTRRARAEQSVTFTVENTVFLNAGKPNTAPITCFLSREKDELIFSDCVFADTRENAGAPVKVLGAGGTVQFRNCETRGFALETERDPMCFDDVPTEIENRGEDWVTNAADPHTVRAVNAADFAAMDALYAGRHPYRGDLHVHTNCGGRSDGHTPMSEWVAKMDEKNLDFAVVVDHRQMRGYFLPEWSEERFLMGTEPGCRMHGLSAVRLNFNLLHYCMLFPHKYSLAMVLANFPEFKFHGDELTGSFEYPEFTKERFMELTRYLQSIGGMMVHAHPKILLASDDPLDFYYGEHTYIETLSGSVYGNRTFKSYEVWTDLLALGKRVYASGGSDTHGDVCNDVVATFYTTERSGRALYDQMYSADYALGGAGIKMCIDGHPMGSEIPYREGMTLTLRVDDFYAPTTRADAVYELRVITDRGVAYASRFRGTAPQAVSLAVKDRAFYRVELYDVYNNVLVAHGNPIWLDK